MKKTIEENGKYKIAIDSELNRVYLTIIGFWRASDQQLQNYVPDLKKAFNQLAKGFTLLTDLRQMKTHPQEVNTFHQGAQKAMTDGGLKYTAEVVENIFVQFQTDKISAKTKMPLKQFTSKEEAEDFLEQIRSEENISKPD